MTAELAALCFSALDPPRLARFWAGLLGWEPAGDATLLPADDTGFRLRFLPTSEPKTRPNQMHVELTSQSLEQQEETVARVLSLGGRHYDAGQLPEEEHVVVADPEGNEFCVIEPGNSFLAECGFLGALSSDGTQEVGYFWSQALGWPLVWDQDEETAIRAPYGGPKIAWGGPPVAPKIGPNRLHFDLSPSTGGDQEAEIERLVSLGATRLDVPSHDPGALPMLDPDGNELCVLAPR
jgi:catechol 2,3-dioxygenase-like lactoylglutathione lyase family enzyme